MILFLRFVPLTNKYFSLKQHKKGRKYVCGKEYFAIQFRILYMHTFVWRIFGLSQTMLTGIIDNPT